MTKSDYLSMVAYRIFSLTNLFFGVCCDIRKPWLSLHRRDFFFFPEFPSLHSGLYCLSMQMEGRHQRSPLSLVEMNAVRSGPRDVMSTTKGERLQKTNIPSPSDSPGDLFSTPFIRTKLMKENSQIPKPSESKLSSKNKEDEDDRDDDAVPVAGRQLTRRSESKIPAIHLQPVKTDEKIELSSPSGFQSYINPSFEQTEKAVSEAEPIDGPPIQRLGTPEAVELLQQVGIANNADREDDYSLENFERFIEDAEPCEHSMQAIANAYVRTGPMKLSPEPQREYCIQAPKPIKEAVSARKKGAKFRRTTKDDRSDLILAKVDGSMAVQQSNEPEKDSLRGKASEITQVEEKIPLLEMPDHENARRNTQNERDVRNQTAIPKPAAAATPSPPAVSRKASNPVMPSSVCSNIPAIGSAQSRKAESNAQIVPNNRLQETSLGKVMPIRLARAIDVDGGIQTAHDANDITEGSPETRAASENGRLGLEESDQVSQMDNTIVTFVVPSPNVNGDPQGQYQSIDSKAKEEERHTSEKSFSFGIGGGVVEGAPLSQALEDMKKNDLKAVNKSHERHSSDDSVEQPNPFASFLNDLKEGGPENYASPARDKIATDKSEPDNVNDQAFRYGAVQTLINKEEGQQLEHLSICESPCSPEQCTPLHLISEGKSSSLSPELGQGDLRKWIHYRGISNKLSTPAANDLRRMWMAVRENAAIAAAAHAAAAENATLKEELASLKKSFEELRIEQQAAAKIAEAGKQWAEEEVCRAREAAAHMMALADQIQATFALCEKEKCLMLEEIQAARKRAEEAERHSGYTIKQQDIEKEVAAARTAAFKAEEEAHAAKVASQVSEHELASIKAQLQEAQHQLSRLLCAGKERNADAEGGSQETAEGSTPLPLLRARLRSAHEALAALQAHVPGNDAQFSDNLKQQQKPISPEMHRLVASSNDGLHIAKTLLIDEIPEPSGCNDGDSPISSHYGLPNDTNIIDSVDREGKYPGDTFQRALSVDFQQLQEAMVGLASQTILFHLTRIALFNPPKHRTASLMLYILLLYLASITNHRCCFVVRISICVCLTSVLSCPSDLASVQRRLCSIFVRHVPSMKAEISQGLGPVATVVDGKPLDLSLEDNLPHEVTSTLAPPGEDMAPDSTDVDTCDVEIDDIVVKNVPNARVSQVKAMVSYFETLADNDEHAADSSTSLDVEEHDHRPRVSSPVRHAGDCDLSPHRPRSLQSPMEAATGPRLDESISNLGILMDRQESQLTSLENDHVIFSQGGDALDAGADRKARHLSEIVLEADLTTMMHNQLEDELVNGTGIYVGESSLVNARSVILEEEEKGRSTGRRLESGGFDEAEGMVRAAFEDPYKGAASSFAVDSPAYSIDNHSWASETPEHRNANQGPGSMLPSTPACTPADGLTPFKQRQHMSAIDSLANRNFDDLSLNIESPISEADPCLSPEMSEDARVEREITPFDFEEAKRKTGGNPLGLRDQVRARLNKLKTELHQARNKLNHVDVGLASISTPSGRKPQSPLALPAPPSERSTSTLRDVAAHAQENRGRHRLSNSAVGGSLPPNPSESGTGVVQLRSALKSWKSKSEQRNAVEIRVKPSVRFSDALIIDGEHCSPETCLQTAPHQVEPRTSSSEARARSVDDDDPNPLRGKRDRIGQYILDSFPEDLYGEEFERILSCIGKDDHDLSHGIAPRPQQNDDAIQHPMAAYQDDRSTGKTIDEKEETMGYSNSEWMMTGTSRIDNDAGQKMHMWMNETDSDDDDVWISNTPSRIAQDVVASSNDVTSRFGQRIESDMHHTPMSTSRLQWGPVASSVNKPRNSRAVSLRDSPTISMSMISSGVSSSPYPSPRHGGNDASAMLSIRPVVVGRVRRSSVGYGHGSNPSKRPTEVEEREFRRRAAALKINVSPYFRRGGMAERDSSGHQVDNGNMTAL